MIKKHLKPFEIYLNSLPGNEKYAVMNFMTDLLKHLSLSSSDRDFMVNDFEKMFIYYSSIKVSTDEAIQRLSISNLKGFYQRPSVAWYPLDNAAKIYPLSMKKNQMALFRISVYLKDEVIPAVLQMALNFIIKRFPSFAATLKSGFFWHYLSATKKHYQVQKEEDVPCKPMRLSRNYSQAFRVLYYNNRISVEFFHILTDGNGALIFLKTLIHEYFKLLGKNAEISEGIFDINEPSSSFEVQNEFHHYAKKVKKISGFKYSPSIQMSGRLSPIRPCQILNFKMDLNELVKVSKKYGGTVTAYLLSLIFIASKNATDENKGIIRIQVPVNMRKFFPSQTILNFSMFAGIELPIEKITTPAQMMEDIVQQLKEKCSIVPMTDMLNTTEFMVNSLRYVPLLIKNPIAHLVYGFMNDKTYTNTISNLGVVTLPKEIQDEVLSFDFMLGTAITNRISCGLISYKNVATLSITKMTADSTFEENMYELLIKDGIEEKIEGSPVYGN